MNSSLTGVLIAHRGIHDGNISENTISAFKKAIENKYIIELDLRFSKDNKIVVFHDSNLKRLFNVDKNISDMTYDVIKNYKFKNGDYIPLFEDVLNTVKGIVPILIEIKVFDNNELLLDKLMEILKDYKGKYIVQSFDYKLIKALKNKYPKVLRGLLLDSTTSFYKKLGGKPNFLSCKKTIINDKKIQKYRKKHLVLVWTIRKKEDIDSVKNYADNYICEYFGDDMN